MDTIVAAVMPAPHAPVELREFPRPDLPPGGALLDTLYSEVCGTDVHLWHGRLAGVPYPIIPGHVSIGTLDGGARPARRARRHATEGRRSRRVLRRPPHLRPLLRLHGGADADEVSVAAGVRHHRSGGRRAAGRMGRDDLPRTRRRDGDAARRRHARNLHRRRLRAADGGPHHRARERAPAIACWCRGSARWA